MNRRWFRTVFVLGCLVVFTSSLGVAAQESTGERSATLLVSGLEGGSGSTIGPDGALYVPENAVGKISRVDPVTGEVTPFASGLPAIAPEVGIGGIMDVAFMDGTAYALVTLVGMIVGTEDVNGIYRIDGPDSWTVVADIGQFSLDNPPKPAFFVPTGVQYALDTYHGDFIVTDGHHNRVLRVTLDGDISEIATFDDIVPTGLEVSASSNTIYMTEAGPVPHLPENGKVMAITLGEAEAVEVAAGARLAVDVEYGCCGTLYALSQGEFIEGHEEGSPAEPNTGSLMRVNADSTVTALATGLNQPTSLEIIGDTAYVVTLGGEIWTVALG